MTMRSCVFPSQLTSPSYIEMFEQIELFFAWTLPSTYCTLCSVKNSISTTIRVLLSVTLSLTQDLKFRNGISAVGTYCQLRSPKVDAQHDKLYRGRSTKLTILTMVDCKFITLIVHLCLRHHAVRPGQRIARVPLRHLILVFTVFGCLHFKLTTDYARASNTTYILSV